ILKNQILGGSEYIYLDTDSEAKLNYLLLPVLAKFSWNLGPKTKNHFSFYADVGPFLGYLLSAHQEYSKTKPGLYDSKDAEETIKVGGVPIENLIAQFVGEDFDITDEIDGQQDIRSDLYRWNVGISGNIGFAYHFARSAIFIEGGGNYGFINIQKDTQNGKNHTGAATVSLGYSYKL